MWNGRRGFQPRPPKGCPNSHFLYLPPYKMSWSAPIAKKEKKEPLKDFKKQRPLLSNASVKRICLARHSDKESCYWLERWIQQFVRECSYPPQLISDDFYSLLNRYFEGKRILEILEKVRYDYKRAFPLNEEVDSLDWIVEVLKKDPMVVAELPTEYL